jgi:CRISPR-associated endoribonuclease Cas6
MIKQYRIHLVADENQAITQNMGYQMYGALMKYVQPDFAERLHEQAASPIAQALTSRGANGKALWTLNLFGEEVIGEVGEILTKYSQFYLEPFELNVHTESIEVSEPIKYQELIKIAREASPKKFYRMNFNTTTSFKSNDEYMIFPSSLHIVSSLINKWNYFSQDFSLEDEDAVREMIRGLKITSYRLSSSRFTMKGTVIPGFQGYIDITPKLSVPLMEIFKLLMIFSNYSGVGIKTSLGMGNVKV